MTIAVQHYLETFRGRQTTTALANATGLSVDAVEEYYWSFPPAASAADHARLAGLAVRDGSALMTGAGA